MPNGTNPMVDQITIRLDPDDIDELMGIAQVADNLQDILKIVNQLEIKTNFRVLSKQVAKKSDLPPREISAALWALVQIYRTQKSLELDPNAALEVITQNLSRAAEDDEELQVKVKVWQSAKGKIGVALNSLNEKHPLILSYKAFRSGASRPNVIVDMDLSTVSHPVFGESGSEIIANIISHVMKLEYHAGPDHDHRELYLSLDNEDVASLRDLCDTADKQSRILKKDLAKAPWPAMLLMDADEANDDEPSGDSNE